MPHDYNNCILVTGQAFHIFWLSGCWEKETDVWNVSLLAEASSKPPGVVTDINYLLMEIMSQITDDTSWLAAIHPAGLVSEPEFRRVLSAPD